MKKEILAAKQATFSGGSVVLKQKEKTAFSHRPYLVVEL